VNRIKDAWLFTRVPSEMDVTRVRAILARPSLPEQLQLDLPSLGRKGPYHSKLTDDSWRLVRQGEIAVIQSESRMLRQALAEAELRLAERDEDVRRLFGALRQARRNQVSSTASGRSPRAYQSDRGNAVHGA